MDKREFINWFTGGERVICSEQDAREFIAEASAENGTQVSESQMSQYINWLREEGIVQ